MPSTIDREAGAGNKFIVSEELNSLGNRFRTICMFQKRRFDEISFFRLWSIWGKHDWNRMNAVDSDLRTAVSRFQGQRICQRRDRPFRNEIRLVIEIGTLNRPLADRDN